METGYHIRIARPDELDVVLGPIDNAADWLRTEKDTTQWARPWPSSDERRKRIHEALLDRQTWLLFDGQRPIGTVSIKTIGNEELWTPEARETEAVYLRDSAHPDHPGAEEPAAAHRLITEPAVRAPGPIRRSGRA